MLRHTFLHLHGVGPATERALWEAGVTTWEQFGESPFLPGRVRNRRRELTDALRECDVRLKNSDAAYFSACFPTRERWRLYPEFRHNTAFLDIETTGLSPYYCQITMVGILDADGYSAYVQGENLEDLRAALEKYDMVVTFNGTTFDLPFIEHFFGRVFMGMAHLDLRMPLRQLGHRGGLKAIERKLGVGRASELSDLSGFDAVLLWRMWEGGDAGARKTLVRYNAEDVASLVPLADLAYMGLAALLPVEHEPLAPLRRPDLDLDYDVDVLRRLEAMRQGRGGAQVF